MLRPFSARLAMSSEGSWLKDLLSGLTQGGHVSPESRVSSRPELKVAGGGVLSNRGAVLSRIRPISGNPITFVTSPCIFPLALPPRVNLP